MSLGTFQRQPENRPPRPPVSIAVLLVVEDAIKVAWSNIRKLPANEFDLVSADEDTITQKLHEVLMDELFDSGTVPGLILHLLLSISAFSVATAETSTPPNSLMCRPGKLIFSKDFDPETVSER